MTNNLLRYKKDQKYIVFDYETEGLNLYYSKPFQLSFVIAQNKKIIKKVDNYISWPNFKISDEAAKVTKFNVNVYNKLKKDAKEVLKEFDHYLYDPEYMVVGHNIANYDVYIHNTHRRLTGHSTDYSYMDRILDTNCLAKSYKCDIPKDVNDNLLQWQQKLISFRKKGVKTNQAAMLKEFNIDFDPDKLHNSLYDVEKNAEMFFQLLWKVEI
jgi:DNA polymerase III alpha subunit (gram-positive type)